MQFFVIQPTYTQLVFDDFEQKTRGKNGMVAFTKLNRFLDPHDLFFRSEEF